MTDHLDIATRCAEQMNPKVGDFALLGMSGAELLAWLDEHADRACMDLQIAIDNARRVGQLDVAGTQIDMFRRAA
jgi:hypothetical protein